MNNLSEFLQGKSPRTIWRHLKLRAFDRSYRIPPIFAIAPIVILGALLMLQSFAQYGIWAIFGSIGILIFLAFRQASGQAKYDESSHRELNLPPESED